MTTALRKTSREYERNGERYEFLKWGSSAFDNFRVVPPGTGICHQVNLEYLAQTVWTKDEDGVTYAYPDTLVGTDSHTTMVNGLAVLGWGVGGIEAEAAMLGQPISMLIPEVVGFKLTGKLPEGATATDLVLTVVEMLRKKGVVGKFVEFFGAGLDTLSLEDAATIANMAPEYGATCGFFPVDNEALDYLRATGRDEDRVQLVEQYSKAQGMFRPERKDEPVFTDTLELDLSSVVPSLAGPKRPQDRVALDVAADAFANVLKDEFKKADEAAKRVNVEGEDFSIGHPWRCGDRRNHLVHQHVQPVRDARRRSCGAQRPEEGPEGQAVGENLAGAGLPGRHRLSGESQPPGRSGRAGLQPGRLWLHHLHRQFRPAAGADLQSHQGRRSGRHVRAVRQPQLRRPRQPGCPRQLSGLPPLVVAYAIAGTMNINVATDPLGEDADGNPVYLKDIWPTSAEIADVVRSAVTPDMFAKRYADVFKGDAMWQGIETSGGLTYDWPESTYVANPPFFTGMTTEVTPPKDIDGARILGLFGDSITTDHISPAGSIKADSPAGLYLQEKGVEPREFNSYGARRGNHDVMMRGTFANIRIKNQMVPGVEGGVTKLQPSGEEMPIYDAAMKYAEADTPLVVFGGKEYGTGSSRDWAAKGTRLLGVKAVICESFERIHRSNLVGMGVVPLQFQNGESWSSLGLTGKETISLKGIEGIKPRSQVTLEITFADGSKKTTELLARIDTENELDYVNNGGILHYVLRQRAMA
jgi:aconitate hydratase